jgi:hypothetical protein
MFERRSYLNGYKAYFAQHADIHFDNGPGDLGFLEEVTLVRNRTQHPESHPIPIVPQKASYCCDDLKKTRRPFFVDDRERALLAEIEEDERLWLMQGQRTLSSFSGKELHQEVGTPARHAALHDVALFARMLLDQAERQAAQPG